MTNHQLHLIVGWNWNSSIKKQLMICRECAVGTVILHLCKLVHCVLNSWNSHMILMCAIHV